MSGGHYGRVHTKLYDLALAGKNTDPNRSVIQTLITLFAQLLHDVDWVDSGDYSPGQELEALDKLLGFAVVCKNLEPYRTLNAAKAARKMFLTAQQIEDEDELLDEREQDANQSD